MSISAMKQALEALDAYSWEQVDAARAALRQAIEQAEKQEPVAFHVHKSAIDENDFKEHVNFYKGPAPSEDFVTLYTAPVHAIDISQKRVDETPECKTDPRAPHGFDRNASHSADRYVCECEGWEPPKKEWVGLTDEERINLVVNSKITEPNNEPIKFNAPSRKCIKDLVLLIEAKLKEKNT